MTVTTSSFRVDFQEFSDPVVYSDPTISFWISVAGKMMDPIRWGDMLDPGTELFVAHQITLAQKNALAAQNGGIPGQSSGPLASKAVDKVSMSYDTGAGTVEGAGFWNLTSYGVQWYQLSLMFGSGGLQL